MLEEEFKKLDNCGAVGMEGRLQIWLIMEQV